MKIRIDPHTLVQANERGTNQKEIIEVFSGKVDLIVDAGDIIDKKPSTVLDLTSEKPKILREGALSASRLKKFLV